MRTRILTVIAACIGITASAFGGFTGVRVANEEKNVIFSIDSKPEVTFTDGEVVISTPDKQVEFPLTSPVSFDFIDISGVNEISASDIHVKITSTEMTISGLEANTPVRVLDYAGTILFETESDSDGTGVIPTGSLPRVPLIVSANNFAYKIIIR